MLLFGLLKRQCCISSTNCLKFIFHQLVLRMRRIRRWYDDIIHKEKSPVRIYVHVLNFLSSPVKRRRKADHSAIISHINWMWRCPLEDKMTKRRVLKASRSIKYPLSIRERLMLLVWRCQKTRADWNNKKKEYKKLIWSNGVNLMYRRCADDVQMMYRPCGAQRNCSGILL